MSPAVSVVVPVYNVRRYLLQALESLATQTLKNLEILVIDDGSTDGSGAIAQEFCREHPAFRYYRQDNSGYGRAVNVGIDLAVGEYVGILEADDAAHEEMFEALYRAAVAQKADVVRGSFYRYWDSADGRPERVEPEGTHQRFLGPLAEGWLSLQDHPKYFFSAASIWSGIYRRTFLIENGIRVLESPGASYQDKPFFLESLFCAKRFYCLARPLVFYRQTNPDSSSAQGTDKGLLLVGLYREMHRRLSQRDPEAYSTWGLDLLVSGLFRDHYWNLRNLKPHLRRTLLRDLRDELRSLAPTNLRQGLRFCDRDDQRLAMVLAKLGPAPYLLHRGVRSTLGRLRRFVRPLRTLIPNPIHRP